MTFTDVDLSDTHAVTVTGVVASGVTTGLPTTATVLGWLSLGALTDTTGTGLGGSDAWSFSAQDKNFDYLAAGESVTLTYTVQVDDRHGGITSQDVVDHRHRDQRYPDITSGAQTGAITELLTPRAGPDRLDLGRHRERHGDLHRRRPQRPSHGDRRSRPLLGRVAR